MVLAALRRTFLNNQSCPANRKAEAGPGNRKAEAGNVFTMLFGGVALVGVLGASTMQFIRGPLTTAVNVNRQTTAETQMTTTSQLVMATSAGQNNNGDCETPSGDTFVEPLPWKTPSGKSPQDVTDSEGGGMLPDEIGASSTDPWGTNYGYCVWDHGPDHGDTDQGCGQARPGGGTNRLVGENSESRIAIAIISAGKDREFETACKSVPTANSGNGEILDKQDGSDDVIYTRTYSEAAASSGGLWELETSQSDTATIDKKASVGDLNSGSFGDYGGSALFANDGLVLGQFTSANRPTCSGATNDGLYVYDTDLNSTVRCNSGTWKQVDGLWSLNGSDVFYNSGNVGIGTNSPNEALDVNGNVDLRSSSSIDFNDNDNTGGSRIDSLGTLNVSSINSNNGNSPINITQSIDVNQSNGSYSAYFDNSVGIGTGGPNATDYGGGGTMLDVIEGNDGEIAQLNVRGDGQGTGMVYVGQSSSHGGGITYNGDDTPNMPTGSDDISIFRRDSGTDHEVLHWDYNNNTAKFEGRIRMQGNNIHMGNSNGDIRMYDGNGTPHIFGDEDSGESDGIVLRTLGNPSNGEPIFVVESSGNAQRLRVEHAGTTSSANNMQAPAFYYSSDKRLKKDLQALEPDKVLNKLTQLDATYYKWKRDDRPEGRQIGLIAQDVIKAFPELVRHNVRYNGKDDYMSVSYGQLTAPLIESVKALKKRNEQLAGHVDTLETQKNTLVKKNAKLQDEVATIKDEIAALKAHNGIAASHAGWRDILPFIFVFLGIGLVAFALRRNAQQ